MIAYPFSKYSGCGNDFIFIDNRNGGFPTHRKELIRNLCHRQLGVGGDGLILLEHSNRADFRMRIFNSDGNEAEMCGNGLRCLGRFMKEQGIPGESFSIQVMENLYKMQISRDTIQIKMGPPQSVEYDRMLTIGERSYSFDFMNTGVPHVIIYVKDLDSVKVDELGSLIRHNPKFAPQGTNVNFVCPTDDGTLKIRTFERGVEKETLACGTGCTATAISARKKLGFVNPIKIITRSGEEIRFSIEESDNKLSDVLMEGPAKFIFKGQIDLSAFM